MPSTITSLLMRLSIIGLCLIFILPSFSAENYTVTTYNLRLDTPVDSKTGDQWERRRPIIESLLQFHNFDIIGTQEGLPHQMQQLSESLNGYDLVSPGRDDGKMGEMMGIFYSKEKFRQLNNGFFWLSDTPEQPGKGWDASLPRIASWVELEDKRTKQNFLVFCTHFDHKGQNARLKSAELIIRKGKELAQDKPWILLGDFNATENSKPYKVMISEPSLQDAFQVAPIKFAHAATFNAFSPDYYGIQNRRIDHIFLTKHFTVKRYAILTYSYRISPEESDDKAELTKLRFPSDHFPVAAEVKLKK